MKKDNIAVFDFDKTISKFYSIFKLIDYFVEKRFISLNSQKVFYKILTEYQEGKIDYNEGTKRVLFESAKELKGKSFELSKRYIREYINNFDFICQYFPTLVESLRNEYDIYILSANMNFIIEPVVEEYNLKGYRSNILEVKDDIFTGKVMYTLTIGKKEVLDLIKDYNKSIAFGDSADDIFMLSNVNIPICVNPDKELKDIALKKGWNVYGYEEIDYKSLKQIGV